MAAKQVFLVVVKDTRKASEVSESAKLAARTEACFCFPV
jgi:hypothetical protein